MAGSSGKSGSGRKGGGGTPAQPRQGMQGTHLPQPKPPSAPYVGNGRPYDATKNPHGSGKPKEKE